MPDPDEAQRRIREMLIEMGYDDLLVEFDKVVEDDFQRDRRITETLDELLREVDELLQRIDNIEDMEERETLSEDEPVEPC